MRFGAGSRGEAVRVANSGNRCGSHWERCKSPAARRECWAGHRHSLQMPPTDGASPPPRAPKGFSNRTPIHPMAHASCMAAMIPGPNNSSSYFVPGLKRAPDRVIVGIEEQAQPTALQDTAGHVRKATSCSSYRKMFRIFSGRKSSTTAMEARNQRHTESLSESCPLAFARTRLFLTLTGKFQAKVQ